MSSAIVCATFLELSWRGTTVRVGLTMVRRPAVSLAGVALEGVNAGGGSGLEGLAAPAEGL